MPSKYPRIDLAHLRTMSIADRKSKVDRTDFATPLQAGATISDFFNSLPNILAGRQIRTVVDKIVQAKIKGKPVVVTMGAHVIKCGLSPLIADLMRRKVITAVALNGAGAIHDFEIASFGVTSEDVVDGMHTGMFGMAEETANFICGGAKVAMKNELGFGEALGKSLAESNAPNKDVSLLATAYEENVPLTVHACIGCDIVHMHPVADGAAIGDASMRDFRILTQALADMGQGGVLINLGSAVVLPEVCLKAITTLINLGYSMQNMTGVNFDFVQHYRSNQQVVARVREIGGEGISLTGHHELMIPLLAAGVIEQLGGAEQVIDAGKCKAALKGIAGKRVMIIGDIMLDEHIWGNAARISPEAPVMVVQVESAESDCRPGGAANVANNIRALGASASVVGIVGDDEGGKILKDGLESFGVDVSGVLIDPNRPTTRKTRIWASHRHQVVRVDWESKKRLSAAIARKVIDYIEQRADEFDAFLISDYDKGMVTSQVSEAIIRIANERNKVSTSNAKPRSISHFGGIGVVTVNQSEASAASGIEIEGIEDVERAGKKLCGVAQCKGLIITRGAHGLTVFEGPDKISHVPAIETEVYDVAGAGDTVVSALTLAMACGLDLVSAGMVANCAGGAVVRKVGVATTSVEEIGELLTYAGEKQ